MFAGAQDGTEIGGFGFHTMLAPLQVKTYFKAQQVATCQKHPQCPPLAGWHGMHHTQSGSSVWTTHLQGFC